MILFVHLYCDSLCSLQVKLYKRKLLSIMTFVLINVILLVYILFIDTSLHKPVVYFASLFYIIIYCYLLIYFIFRDDTFVISSILHV
jgi:hypothetical protein